ncbi:YdcF family protein [Paenibacillus pinisoli]|nr:YdcF family protein [Paenibacillus pinisoli]
MSVFMKRALIAAAILVSWFIIHSVLIILDGLTDELKPVDVAVVLGNKVELNGQPSERLKARLDRTVELYEEEYFPMVIVSGGIGSEGFDEAKVMKAYLVDQGIPGNKIFEDNNGYNSYMTAQNANRIMKELELDSAMIVTQYYHVTRTKLAFRKMDVSDVYGAHARFFEIRDVYSIIREFPAYYKYLIAY